MWHPENLPGGSDTQQVQHMSNNSQEEAEEAECEFQAEGTVCKAVSTYSQPFQGTESKI